jgi:phosphotransferase system  glucose/maltose/N-acetylglucosamine-specific IIC component
MQKVLSAIVLFLMSLPILAATKELEGANAPVETVDTIYVVIFGIIFVGGVIGFFVYLFWTDRDKKSD